jgi:hypothetical protein
MQHADIFIFSFKLTQLAIIRVFRIINCFPFLAHLAKGNVGFCHHLASVVD